jgi:hypothetical protein
MSLGATSHIRRTGIACTQPTEDLSIWTRSRWPITASASRSCIADTDLATFRLARDELFATHPQSPIPAAERAEFAGVRYFPESPDARVTVAMRQPSQLARAALAHPFQQSAKVECDRTAVLIDRRDLLLYPGGGRGEPRSGRRLDRSREFGERSSDAQRVWGVGGVRSGRGTGSAGARRWR